MRRKHPSTFNFLTLAVFIAFTVMFTGPVWSMVNQEKFKTHLRWTINTAKDQIYLSKNGNVLNIETLNINLYKKLSVALQNLGVDNEYFNDISYDRSQYPSGPAIIKVGLKDKSIELFSFYKKFDKNYIVDFWVNQDEVKERRAATKKTKAQASKAKNTIKTTKVAAKIAKVDKKKTVTKKAVQKKTKKVILPTTAAKSKPASKKYRGFRYGAALVWDYPPLKPKFKPFLDLKNKTPEFFYPVENRQYTKDDKEAHMQLSINLFRKGKWGLMYKSIKLYQKKYGVDKNQDLNGYLKVNALLRNNFKDQNKGIINTAIALMKDIISRTEVYELKKALLQYVTQHYLNENDHVRALDFSKQLYVVSNKNFDEETSIIAATAILHNLSSLFQVDKVLEFINDKTIRKLLPGQVKIAYQIYALINQEKVEDVVDLYNKNVAAMVKPVKPSILFNVAEAYFRKANYKKAITVFDQFVDSYSFINQAAHARMRIALSYDFMDEAPKKVLELYRNTIDRAGNFGVRYEAKVRYVGLGVARKKQLSPSDEEKIVFLEHAPEEVQALRKNKDLQQLLWLVRLRTLINTNKLKKALSYLTSLPLNSFKSVERRMFEADGAEIVYGLIRELYNESNYADAIKYWEIYRNKYLNKVALNPYLNFLICHAYLKLGLNDSFKRTYASFKKLKDEKINTFPMWIPRRNIGTVKGMLAELDLLKLMKEKQWKKAAKATATLKKVQKDFPKIDYYRGVIAYQLKDFNEARKHFEMIFGKKYKMEMTSHEVTLMVNSYIDSLYQSGDEAKFQEVAKAFLNDLSKSALPEGQRKLLVEKTSYLLIESIASDKNVDFENLDQLTSSFTKNFDKSIYLGRVIYLQGCNLLKNERIDQGKAILEKLINNKSVPEYIKQLAQTELSSVELWNTRL